MKVFLWFITIFLCESHNNLQNKNYYIPGDAILYGTMNNGHGGQDEPATSIRIFGHGTLSGDKLPHPNFADPPIADDEHWLYHPLDIEGLKKKNKILHFVPQSKIKVT